jgi:hypothetical protein
MFKISTWLVCSLLNLAVQLDRAFRGGTTDGFALVEAVIVALVIGAVWALLAGWVRGKYLINLSDRYVRNLKIGFGSVAVVMILLVLGRHIA